MQPNHGHASRLPSWRENQTKVVVQRKLRHAELSTSLRYSLQKSFSKGGLPARDALYRHKNSANGSFTTPFTMLDFGMLQLSERECSQETSLMTDTELIEAMRSRAQDEDRRTDFSSRQARYVPPSPPQVAPCISEENLAKAERRLGFPLPTCSGITSPTNPSTGPTAPSPGRKLGQLLTSGTTSCAPRSRSG
jgi:hypothetical protein